MCTLRCTVYDTHQSPTCFATKVPSSGSYCNKGTWECSNKNWQLAIIVTYFNITIL